MHTDRADPRSELEAKFSVQYCVARALLDGKVVLEHFEGDAYDEPAVQELLPRVHAIPYTGPLFDPEDPFDAEVRITLTDGSSLAAKVDRPLGRTAQNPIPFEHLQEKFQNCAQRVVSAEAAAAAARLIASMETLAAVGDLTALLEPAARAQVSSIVHA
jgi:2-methylcitrate dehydratase PrpD